MQLIQKDFVPSHGTGGFFGGLCLNAGVTSAVPLPRGGLIDVLPRTSGSITETREFGIVTGVTAETEVAAATSCDDPRFTAGDLKLGTLSCGFGMLSMKTDLIDIKAVGGMQACEVDPPVLMVGGDIESQYWQPSLGGAVSGDSVNLSSPGNKALYELYSGLIRVAAPTTFSGTGVAVDPTYTPMKGLDLQIVDTLVDANTNAAIPRANSKIVDFAGADVTAAPATTIQTIINMHESLKYKAMVFGLDPVVISPVMRAGLFNELTAIWPCAYMTNRCANPAGSTVNIGGMEQVTMRNEMRSGRFLWINGQRVPVVLDEGIPVVAGTPNQSTIYFVPRVIKGNRAATVVDYYNWNSPIGLGDATFKNLVGHADAWSVIDNGRFLMIRNPMTNGCLTVNIYTKPRLLVLTPQIAGRMINVGFEYTEFDNVEWNPAEPDYLNGGEILRN